MVSSYPIADMRAIEGFDGYFVTNDGRVWSIKEIAPVDHDSGYMKVRFYPGGGRVVWRYVHRVVAEAFLGKPAAGHEVRHLDGNRKNNDVQNLAWGTHLENMQDRDRHNATARGERHGRTIHSDETIAKILDLRSNGFTYAQISEMTGVSRWWVPKICKGKRKVASMADEWDQEASGE